MSWSDSQLFLFYFPLLFLLLQWTSFTPVTLAANPRTISNAGLLPRDKLLKSLKYHQIDTDLGLDLIDKAEVSLRTWTTTETDFLSPLEASGVLSAFKDLSVGVLVSCSGGYPQAERKRVFFERAVEGIEDMVPLADEPLQPFAWQANVESFIAALNVQGNFMMDKATLQDFETSVLAVDASIKRGDIGDIIITGERGAHMLCKPQICDTVCKKLKQIRSVPLLVSRIELKDLAVRPLTVKEITCVEASMRLDAIASAAFGLSRSKVVKLVEQGHVSVEFKPMLNAAYNLLEGQTFAVRGSGKCVVSEVSETSKGRWRLKLTRTT